MNTNWQGLISNRLFLSSRHGLTYATLIKKLLLLSKLNLVLVCIQCSCYKQNNRFQGAFAFCLQICSQLVLVQKTCAQTTSELNILCEGVKLKCKDMAHATTDLHINPHYATKHFKCQSNKKKCSRQGKKIMQTLNTINMICIARHR